MSNFIIYKTFIKNCKKKQIFHILNVKGNNPNILFKKQPYHNFFYFFSKFSKKNFVYICLQKKSEKSAKIRKKFCIHYHL